MQAKKTILHVLSVGERISISHHFQQQLLAIFFQLACREWILHLIVYSHQ